MEEEIANSPQLAAAVRGGGGKPVSEMSDEEKGFYYFKLHDVDNNDALDGLELMQAAMHGHEHDEHDHRHDDEPDSIDPDDPNNENDVAQTAEDDLTHIICK